MESNAKENNNNYQIGLNEINEPEFYLLITGEAGKNNYGILVRSASAFDCKEIFILGNNKNILKKFFGNHGTAKKMKYTFFSSADELNNHCLKNNIQICGVNINYKYNDNIKAIPIQDIDFENKKTLFILGNSMYPISNELEKIITKYTYIDQVSKDQNKHELNLSIIGTIAMHYFGVKNSYRMAGLNDLYNDEKYVVVKANNNNIHKNENKKAKIE